MATEARNAVAGRCNQLGRIRGRAIGAAGAAAANTPDSVAADNLVLWLRADDGVATGGARQYTSATSEEHQETDNTNFRPGDADFTIAGWFYLDSAAANMGICSKWNAAGQAEYRLAYIHGSTAFRWSVSQNGSSLNDLDHGVTVETDKWYFFVAEHENGVAIRLNINEGTEVTLAHTTGIHEGTETFAIGSFSNANTLNGRASKFGFWNRLLTAAEKTYLFNKGNGRTYGAIGVTGTDGSDLKTSLDEYWNLNESVGDAKGNHANKDLTDTNTVTAAGGPSFTVAAGEVDPVNNLLLTGFSADQLVANWNESVPGAIGTGMSLKFDGSSTYLNGGDLESMSFGSGEWTFSFWVNMPATAVASEMIAKQTGQNGTGYRITAEGSQRLNVRIDDGLNVASAQSTGAIDTGTWRHCVALRDNTLNEIRIYLDGSEANTADTSAVGDIDNTVDFNIGRNPDGTRHMPATMDDVQVFGRALTDNEITYLFTGGSSGTDPGSPDVEHWKFDDGPQHGNITDGDPVIQWKDMSGNNKLFSQGTASARPSYTLNAVNAQQPGIVFDGTDDILVLLEDYLTTQSGVVWIVLQSTSNGAREIAFSAVNSAFDDEFQDIGEITSSNFGYEWNNNLGASEPVEHPDGVNLTAHILRVLSTDAKIEVYQDGNHETENNPGGSNSGNWYGTIPTVDKLCIGGKEDATPSNFYHGAIGEIIVYDTLLTNLQMAQIEDYLADRYGLTLIP